MFTQTKDLYIPLFGSPFVLKEVDPHVSQVNTTHVLVILIGTIQSHMYPVSPGCIFNSIPITISRKDDDMFLIFEPTS